MSPAMLCNLHNLTFEVLTGTAAALQHQAMPGSPVRPLSTVQQCHTPRMLHPVKIGAVR
jgi:hypothetical protein